jgi:hypothetical protein
MVHGSITTPTAAQLRQEARALGLAMRPNRLRRSKYGDLKRLRATRGVGRPPAQRTVTVMSTDLISL